MTTPLLDRDHFYPERFRPIRTEDGSPDYCLVNGEPEPYDGKCGPAFLTLSEWEKADHLINKEWEALQRRHGISSYLDLPPSRSLPNRIAQHDPRLCEIGMTPLPFIFWDLPGPLSPLHGGFHPLDKNREGVPWTEVFADKLFSGFQNLLTSGMKMEEGTVYGLTTHPKRNTMVLSGNRDDDLSRMVQVLRDQRYYGPFLLYENDTEYVPCSSYRTLLEKKNPFYLPFLKPGELVLLHNREETVRLVRLILPTLVQWDFGIFRVFLSYTPEFRTNLNGHLGIVHGFLP